MKRLIVVMALAVACSGCSTMSDVCSGTAAGQAALGGFNPLAVPCIANDVVYIGSNAISLSGSSSSAEQYKTFRSSKAVYDDMSNHGDLMQFVLDSQDRYKTADYGNASGEQKTRLVGKYVSVELGKSIVIIDAQKSWLVMYEAEYTPEPTADKKS